MFTDLQRLSSAHWKTRLAVYGGSVFTLAALATITGTRVETEIPYVVAVGCAAVTLAIGSRISGGLHRGAATPEQPPATESESSSQPESVAPAAVEPASEAVPAPAAPLEAALRVNVSCSLSQAARSAGKKNRKWPARRA